MAVTSRRFEVVGQQRVVHAGAFDQIVAHGDQVAFQTGFELGRVMAVVAVGDHIEGILRQKARKAV
jgi:hypothetical protein